MQPQQPHVADNASVNSYDQLYRPLRSDEMAKLKSNNIAVSGAEALENALAAEISEAALRQLIYFLIWKKIEMDLLDENSGIVAQFERTLDGYSNSFGRAFK